MGIPKNNNGQLQKWKMDYSFKGIHQLEILILITLKMVMDFPKMEVMGLVHLSNSAG